MRRLFALVFPLSLGIALPLCSDGANHGRHQPRRARRSKQCARVCGPGRRSVQVTPHALALRARWVTVPGWSINAFSCHTQLNDGWSVGLEYLYRRSASMSCCR